MAGARKHHYIPRFFLAGFTREGAKDGRLLVCDLGSGNRWWSDPNGAGHHRDFYTIDLAGYDPLDVENAFRKVEDAAAPALRRITEADEPPPFDNVAADVLPLLASLVIRVPTSRRAVEHVSERVARSALRRALPSMPKPPPPLHSKLFGHLPTGTEPSPEEFNDAMQKFLRIEIGQTWSIAHMLSGFDLVLRRLAELHWSLAVPTTGAPDFISSDNPVCFGPADLTGVSSFVALSRRVAAVGTLYEPEESVIRPDGRFVGLINGLTIGGAERYIFSSSEQIHWKNHDGTIGDVSTLPRRDRLERPA